MQKIKELILSLSCFERILFASSVICVTASFILCGSRDWLTLAASLTGAASLIFLAKGKVIGQVLMVIFSLMYGVISLRAHYYGEMITYLGMTAPMSVVALIEWIKHPSKKTGAVEISRMMARKWVLMLVLCAVVTAVFYFILERLGNASLIMSTVSIATSFIAVFLTACCSPLYALAYAANDIVLIVLWIAAASLDSASAPMIVCFAMFLANDIYGYISWRRRGRLQECD